MERTLYRSRGERMVAGVAGGIAQYFGIDPTLVRLAWVALALVTSGGAIVAYVIMAIVVPEEPLPGDTATPGSPVPPAAPPESSSPAEEPEVGMAEDRMGPGDMPEPGEFGQAPVPDPSEGVPPSRAYARASAEEPGAAAGPERPTEPPRESGRSGVTVGLILIAVGAVFLLERLTGFGWGELWPLILIAIGISIMFGRGR